MILVANLQDVVIDLQGSTSRTIDYGCGGGIAVLRRNELDPATRTVLHELYGFFLRTLLSELGVQQVWVIGKYADGPESRAKGSDGLSIVVLQVR